LAVITGTNNHNNLNGTDDPDFMTGLGAADTIKGGLGGDTMFATVNDGNDTMFGDGLQGGNPNDPARSDPGDTYDLSATSTGASVDLRDGAASSAQAGSDTLVGFENVVGSTGDDDIRGDEGDNVLTGLAGNDTLIGRGGADTMTGGLGDDTYGVDDVGDVVVESANEGTDTINCRINAYTLGAGVERIVFLGAGDFVGTGNELANRLIGGGGADTLFGGGGVDSVIGGAGNDFLDGGSGGDVLEGGAGDDTLDMSVGADTARFLAGFGSDTVLGFGTSGSAQDHLDLRGFGITAATFDASVTITQDVGFALVVFGGGDVKLMGVLASSIDASDFRLS